MCYRILFESCQRFRRRNLLNDGRHGRPGGRRQVAKARMAIAVLKAALTFGIMCRKPGCPEFRAVIDAMRFEGLPSRNSFLRQIRYRLHAKPRGSLSNRAPLLPMQSSSRAPSGNGM